MTDQTANNKQNSNQQLVSRGLLDAALKAQWQTSQRAWVYPIYDLNQQILTYRYKAYNSAANPKAILLIMRYLPNAG